MNNSNSSLKILEVLIIGFFLAFISYNMFLGQKISIANGLGWDGATTADMLKNFNHYLALGKFDLYNLQHFFPNSILYIVSTLISLPFTDKYILQGTIITNYCVMLLSVITAYSIFFRHQFSIQLRILCFIGMFLNFAHLKFSGYYPLLPDTTAFFLGLLLYWAYSQNKFFLFLLVALVGDFTFPSFALLGLLLFSFDPKTTPLVKKNKFYYSIFCLISLPILLLSLRYIAQSGLHAQRLPSYLLHFFKQYSHFLTQHLPMLNPKRISGDISLTLTQINFPLAWLSLLSLCVYFFFTQALLWKNMSAFFMLKQLKIYRLLAYTIFIYGTVYFINKAYCLHRGYSTLDYLLTITYLSITHPLGFLVMHFVYFGPVAILFILFWKDFIQYIQSSSIGLFLFTSLSLVMIIDSESRHLINIMPVFILTFALAIKNNNAVIQKLTPKFLAIWTVLSVLVSCCWFPISLPEHIPEASGINQHVFQSFPYQSYFMFQGPWVSHQMYYSFLLIFLIIYLVSFIFFKKKTF